MICPTCGNDAEHRVYVDHSTEFPAGPAIRVCHSSREGAFIHVMGDDDE